VGGARRSGRPRKTWEKVVRRDIRDLNLNREMALDRAERRRVVRRQDGNEPSWAWQNVE
jgi:hypothetical protein